MLFIFYFLIFVGLLWIGLYLIKAKGVTSLFRYEFTSVNIYLEKGSRWSWMYDLGTVVVLFGIVVAQAVLSWATIVAFKAVIILFNESQAVIVGKEPGVPSRMMKRAIAVVTQKAPTAATSTLLLRPIVPTTLFPLVLLALIISQVFHEMGHAKASSLRSSTTLQFGFIINFIFPSFYIKLPPNINRDYLSELRIAAAGVWHSLMLIGIAFFLSRSGTGISNKITSSVFSDTFSQGVQVISIPSYSPLFGLIGKGEIISHLNDLELDSLEGNGDMWNRYLTGKISKRDAEYDNMGWCLARDQFDGSNIAKGCCATEDFAHPRKEHTLCFSIQPDQNHYTKLRTCINPLTSKNSLFLPVLHERNPERCVSNGDCKHGFGCARPDKGEAVLRMTVISRRDAEKRVIVFQGTRKNVWDQVIVSDRSPRFWFVPIGFEGYLELFWKHVQSISLAIAFFNLLPLRYLDGSEIIKALLSHLTTSAQSLDPPSTASSFSRLRSEGLLVSLLAFFVLPYSSAVTSSPQPTPSASPSLSNDYWSKKSSTHKRVTPRETETLWWKAFKFLRIYTIGCLSLLVLFSAIVEILCYGRVEVGRVLG